MRSASDTAISQLSQPPLSELSLLCESNPQQEKNGCDRKDKILQIAGHLEDHIEEALEGILSVVDFLDRILGQNSLDQSQPNWVKTSVEIVYAQFQRIIKDSFLWSSAASTKLAEALQTIDCICAPLRDEAPFSPKVFHACAQLAGGRVLVLVYCVFHLISTSFPSHGRGSFPPSFVINAAYWMLPSPTISKKESLQCLYGELTRIVEDLQWEINPRPISHQYWHSLDPHLTALVHTARTSSTVHSYIEGRSPPIRCQTKLITPIQNISGKIESLTALSSSLFPILPLEGKRLFFSAVDLLLKEMDVNSQQYMIGVLGDLDASIPPQAPTETLAFRIFVEAVHYLDEATKELNSRWWLLLHRFSRVSGHSKRSTALSNSMSKLHYLDQLCKSYSSIQSFTLNTKFLSLWSKAITGCSQVGGRMFRDGITSIEELQTAVEGVQYTFLSDQSEGREIWHLLEPLKELSLGFAQDIICAMGVPATSLLASLLNALFETAENHSGYKIMRVLFSRIYHDLHRLSIYDRYEKIPNELEPILVQIMRCIIRVIALAIQDMNRPRIYRTTRLGKELKMLLSDLQGLVDEEMRVSRTLILQHQGIHKCPVPKAISQMCRLPYHSPPPPPDLLLGRDKERDSAVHSLLQGNPTALLGPPGIGKTYTAQSVLNDPKIKEKYPDICFVSCSETPSLSVLYLHLAHCLEIAVEDPLDSRLKDLILDVLRSKQALVCFDNFETVWDGDERIQAETLLSYLADLQPSVVILITMRGTQCPMILSWDEYHLEPLSREDGLTVFQHHSRCADNDPCVQKLVDATGCLPLALKLLSRLARDNTESTQDIWLRWVRNGTAAVSVNDDGNRHMDLNASIELSLRSPRLAMYPEARPLMYMLSRLPTGLPKSGPIWDHLECSAPRVASALLVLTRLSLVQVVNGTSTQRYRLLPTIARFSQGRLAGTLELEIVMKGAYVAFIRSQEPRKPLSYRGIADELPNMRSVLDNAASAGIDEDLALAINNYSWWIFFQDPDAFEDQLVQQAVKSPCVSDAVKTNGFELLGHACATKNEYADAMYYLEKALSLYRKQDDIRGVADTSQKIAEVSLRVGQPVKAKEYLKQAWVVHRKIHDSRGQEEDLKLLATACGMEYGNGEKDLLIWIQSWLEEVEKSESFRCYILGMIYLSINELERAEELVSQAVSLSENPKELGYSLLFLGRILLRLDRLQDCESVLCRAVGIHQKLGDSSGEGRIRTEQGELFIHLDRLDEAKACIIEAMELHQRCHRNAKGEEQARDAKNNEGCARGVLGIVYLEQSELGSAKNCFQEAIKLLGEGGGAPIDEANCWCGLGEVCLRQGELEDAESYIRRSIEFQKQAYSEFGEGLSQISLGRLYLRRGKTTEALEILQASLSSIKRSHSKFYEAYAVQEIGNAHLAEGNFLQAKEQFSLAMELHGQTQNERGKREVKECVEKLQKDA